MLCPSINLDNLNPGQKARLASIPPKSVTRYSEYYDDYAKFCSSNNYRQNSDESLHLKTKMLNRHKMFKKYGVEVIT